EIFLEIVIAPSFSTEALTILQAKKNIRLLTIPMDQDITVYEKMTSVKGGLLVQTNDSGKIDEADLTVVTKTKPSEAEIEDLLFAWKAVKHVKSNAIVLAKNKQTIGIGAGQMNRIGAAEIAIKQAGEKAQASVLEDRNDSGKIDEAGLTVVTKTKPSEAEIEDLLFAWKAVKHVKSNAIVLAKNKQTIGIGAGQMNRIGAAEIAIKQAGEKAQASVL